MTAVGEKEFARRRVEPRQEHGGHQSAVEGHEQFVGPRDDRGQRVPLQREGANRVRHVQRAAGARDPVPEGVHDRDVNRPVGQEEPVVEVPAGGGVGAGRFVMDGEFHAVHVDRVGAQGVLQLLQHFPVGPAHRLVAFLELDVQGEDTAVGLGQFVLEAAVLGGEGVRPGQRGPQFLFQRFGFRRMGGASFRAAGRLRDVPRGRDGHVPGGLGVMDGLCGQGESGQQQGDRGMGGGERDGQSRRLAVGARVMGGRQADAAPGPEFVCGDCADREHQPRAGLRRQAVGVGQSAQGAAQGRQGAEGVRQRGRPAPGRRGRSRRRAWSDGCARRLPGAGWEAVSAGRGRARAPIAG